MLISSILLGYEKLEKDEIGWNFNGRYEENKLKLTDTQYNQLDDFLKAVYTTSINPLDNPGLTNYFSSQSSPIILKKSVTNIQNEKYLYCIRVGNLPLYVNNTSHISISDKVRDDVIKKQAKIVLILDSEGDAYYYLESLKKLILDLTLPKEQIYFVHGDYDVEKFVNEPYRYKIVDPFPFWVPYGKIKSVVKYNPDKLILTYNRAVRSHRILLLGLLLRNNLLQDSIYSLGPLGSYVADWNRNLFNSEFSDLELNNLFSISSKTFDLPSIVDTTHTAGIINEDHHERTFVSVVTETWANKEIKFFSEKTYKPILTGHPFIILGNPGLLKILKDRGFKTFDKYWDESYDNEIDLLTRTKKIVSILKDLKSYSTEKLVSIRADMQDILIHNRFKLLKELTTNSYVRGETPLYRALLEIYNE